MLLPGSARDHPFLAQLLLQTLEVLVRGEIQRGLALGRVWVHGHVLVLLLRSELKESLRAVQG